MNNLFFTNEYDGQKEEFETLVENGAIKLERIISFGHPTPPNEWYDQAEYEWVSLIQGSATLLFETGEKIKLEKGDSITLKPHHKHRVEKVSDDAIWIALFYEK